MIEAYFSARLGTPSTRALYAFGATHGGDVAGLGQASPFELIKEAEGPGILRVSAPSALSDGDFLLWGTDKPADFSLSSDVPLPFPQRLTRTWAYTLTDGGRGDGVGTVTLRFRVGGLFLSLSPGDFALLFDEDGNFADADVHTGPSSYDTALDAIEFTDVSLPPARFLALAVRPRD
jgi:hypothetical protein